MANRFLKNVKKCLHHTLLPPLTFDVDMYDRPCMVDDSKNSRRISMSKKICQTTDKK